VRAAADGKNCPGNRYSSGQRIPGDMHIERHWSNPSSKESGISGPDHNLYDGGPPALVAVVFRKGGRRIAHAGRARVWPTPPGRVMRLGPGRRRPSAVLADGCDNEPVIGG
jgi:hypothetical protein